MLQMGDSDELVYLAKLKEWFTSLNSGL
jgi:hypothetical protein